MCTTSLLLPSSLYPCRNHVMRERLQYTAKGGGGGGTGQREDDVRARCPLCAARRVTAASRLLLCSRRSCLHPTLPRGTTPIISLGGHHRLRRGNYRPPATLLPIQYPCNTCTRRPAFHDWIFA